MTKQSPIENYAKFMWKYKHRLHRCAARALRESGSFDKQMEDMVIYGTGFYTNEQQKIDALRTRQLMEGLKP